MSNLTHVLTKVAEAYKGKVATESRVYHVVDFMQCFEGLSKPPEDIFRGVTVLVPLNRQVDYNKIRLRISTGGEVPPFAGYHQLETGICIPDWVAKQAGFSSKPYQTAAHLIILDRA